VTTLQGLEGYIFSRKFFGPAMWDDFTREFQSLRWITYCEQFKPLLMEVGKWLDKPVLSLQTDNGWGCTLRCLQMLVANSLP